MLARSYRREEIFYGFPKPTHCRIYGEQIHKYGDKVMMGNKMTAFPKLVKLCTYMDASSSQVILPSICCVLPIQRSERNSNINGASVAHLLLKQHQKAQICQNPATVPKIPWARPCPALPTGLADLNHLDLNH